MYLEEYTSLIADADLISAINKTSAEVFDNVQSFFDFRSHLNGLFLGGVQSGKTAQILGVVSKLADEGYRLFILLTTDNVDLHRQTYNRALNSLLGFNVLSEKDEIKFLQYGLMKPMVLVLKKNASVLRKWRNNLVNSKICTGICLVIFDDEGDAASLNTLVNRNRTSTINRYLSDIKNTATSSLYFEVTATPQAILLQSDISGWRPSFVNYFKPGKGYIGGNFFYSNPTSYCIRFTNDYELDDIISDDDIFCPQGLRNSLLSFLVVCAYKKLKGEFNCNFMIHPSSRIDIHNKFVERVQEYLNLLQTSSQETSFDYNLHNAWLDLQRNKPDIMHYEDIKNIVVELLDNTEILVIPLNSKSFVCRDSSNPDALDLSKGFNIIVGGNTLGRGITFPHLQTVYYCRTSKTPQADTFWQHSRIFGYDREAELVRIYIPKHLYKLFSDLNESNEILIKQIEGGIGNIQIIYPDRIKPTRKNVLDNNYLNIISGGVNIFASEPISSYTDQVDSCVLRYVGEESVIVDVELILQLLMYTGSCNVLDFNNKKYTSCIQALKSKRPKIKFRLVIRTDRDVTKGTGTLLSPNDRILGDKFCEDVVLTLYRVNGSIDKGWEGQPLWIPNIKFPIGCCFYNVD